MLRRQGAHPLAFIAFSQTLRRPPLPSLRPAASGGFRAGPRGGILIELLLERGEPRVTILSEFVFAHGGPARRRLWEHV